MLIIHYYYIIKEIGFEFFKLSAANDSSKHFWIKTSGGRRLEVDKEQDNIKKKSQISEPKVEF